ncbi:MULTISPECIES: RNA recognition motif domain-containing protein [Vibrio]|uniref:RNA-binding protein n=1 Tax=Vibrio algicola TaxID=2662262 RepID=A0A5Q0TI06_9VIBR|nr:MULTISPECIES: RNA-binding protein [Vibrio]MBD1577192.1 RNA-binding protein [Vibrio sp. S11_S32]
MKILARNLARTMTEHEVRVLFTEHGSVGTCNLVLDAITGQSKGFAFVEMPSDDEAKKAIESLNQALVAGQKIRVKKADA